MMNADEKYEKLIKILRNSKPVMSSPESLEEAVMEKILKVDASKKSSLNIWDYLFGWVYIGWMRKGLIASSVLIVAFFIFQQGIILKRINYIEKQAVMSEGTFHQEFTANGNDTQVLLKLTGGKTLESFTMSRREINKLMRSYEELQNKYKDLLKLIEEDPDIRQYVENKLTERQKRKFNL